MEAGTLTVNNLGRYFYPEPLFFGIMKVDNLRKEENDCRSPEHCDITVRLERSEERKERTHCKTIEGRNKLQGEAVSGRPAKTFVIHTPRATGLLVLVKKTQK